MKEGYLPLINAGPGIYIGEVLVSPRQGNITIYSINTNTKDVELIIPPVKLEEFDIVNITNNKNHSKSEDNSLTSINARVEEFKTSLFMDDLNEEEKESLFQSIKKFSL